MDRQNEGIEGYVKADDPVVYGSFVVVRIVKDTFQNKKDANSLILVRTDSYKMRLKK